MPLSTSTKISPTISDEIIRNGIHNLHMYISTLIEKPIKAHIAVSTKCVIRKSRKVCQNELRCAVTSQPTSKQAVFTILCTSSYDVARGHLLLSSLSCHQLQQLPHGPCYLEPVASGHRRPTISSRVLCHCHFIFRHHELKHTGVDLQGTGKVFQSMEWTGP